jgi:hypothetical protein
MMAISNDERFVYSVQHDGKRKLFASNGSIMLEHVQKVSSRPTMGNPVTIQVIIVSWKSEEKVHP